jgi:diketogulonate reductase-like aldo/keto reductase
MPIYNASLPLATGATIPTLGFGTWQIPDGAPAYSATLAALRAGYRHVDSARAYGNEESVGRAVRDSGLARGDVFVTSKLPAEIKDHTKVQASFDETMRLLALDYVDLYLIHAPWPWSEIGKDCTAQNKQVWTQLEAIHGSGRARAIGVSNFSVADMRAILDGCAVKPMVNQIRWFVGHTQPDVVAFCRQHGIVVEAYSPLATGRILHDPRVAAIALGYGKSVAQVCIRYALQSGTVALPKSTHPARIVENADVGFVLSAADMALLDGLSDAS